MVAFQPDNDSRTTGTGTFDLSDSAGAIIDPPPHDHAYFRNHLLFAENYFRTCSRGRQVVTTTILDSVYRLPHPMQYYSPPHNSPTDVELGKLMQDSWHLVDSVTPGTPYNRYQAFVLFHAGVGRDVDFTSLFGYDPTPFDIPSLYVNLASLRKMFGESYDGIPVAGGTMKISNSMILPETESRPVPNGFGGTFLYQLGVNGLITASIGSHLGLPDLFDTKTGRTGIGRFGLMDGQSIFSWSGVIPPMPSAWERMRLGWVTPITIARGDSIYRIPAVSRANSADTVYRVLISEREYFLVENRNRDANRDSARFTIARNGTVVHKAWWRDLRFKGFSEAALDQDSLYGVVTDVDEFDWSVPGSVYGNDTTFYDGGILIWHIDENVIDAGIAADAVNADRNRRGVNLMEADGSQDIGEVYNDLSGRDATTEGTPLDFWYAGNIAPLRILSNEFTPTSHPASLSNDLANSHVSMRAFSARGPLMTAAIAVGDGRFLAFPGFPEKLGSIPGRSSLLPADIDGDGYPELLISTTGKYATSDTGVSGDGRILAWKQDGSPYFQTPDSLANFLTVPGSTFDPPAALDFNGDGKLDIATFLHETSPAAHGVPMVVSGRDSNADHQADVILPPFATQILSASSPPASIVASRSHVAWLTDGALSHEIGGTGFGVSSVSGGFTGAAVFGNSNDLIAISGSDVVRLNDSTMTAVWRTPISETLSGSPAVGVLSGPDSLDAVVLSRAGNVYLLNASGRVEPSFPVAVHDSISGSPAIADVDGDGRKDIVFAAGRKLYALNGSGVPLDNFPISVPTQMQILASPVIGDINADGSPDIVIGTQEGLLVAYSSRGRMLDGFPLLTGGAIQGSAAIFRSVGGIVGLGVGSDDRYLYAWDLLYPYDSTRMPWPMAFHDVRHSGYEGSAPPIHPISSEFFPAARSYNWPNPVDRAHNFRTHIRYYLASDAKVHIKIIDLGGDQVTEFDGPGNGGLDNEVEWDVSGIQSGIYFAHIEAQGAGGSGTAIVKIAVVK